MGQDVGTLNSWSVSLVNPVTGSTANYVPKWNSSSSFAPSSIFDNGNVGIGTATPSTKLEVNGQVKITGGTPGAGKVLTSDATGLASWTTPVANTCGYTIGQNVLGGIIFYLDPSGCHGLISAPTDQSTAAQWWNGSNLDTKAYGSGLFEGSYNTVMIQNLQGGTTSAAAICSNLALGGFIDWYLPSIHELRLMYQNIGQGNSLGLGNVGGFASASYWSSTENTTNVSWYENFTNGSQNFFTKNATSRVRAVRAF